MRVLVLGGSGFLGTALTRSLVRRGYRVDVPTRTADGARRVERSGAQPIVGDFVRGSPDFVARLESPDAIVLLAGPRLFGRRLTARRMCELRGEVTGIFRAAIDLGAELRTPLIVTSGASFRTSGSQVADETWPIERVGAAAIGEETDTLIAEAVVRGTPTLVQMLPGQIYGPGGMLKDMVAMARRGRAGYIGDGSNVLPRIHVEDCALAYTLVVERLHSLPTGTRYIVADDEGSSGREFAEILGRCLKLPPPRRIPRVIAWMVLGRSLFETVTMNCRVTNRKLKSDLGWSPRFPSIRDGLPAAIAALERGDILP